MTWPAVLYLVVCRQMVRSAEERPRGTLPPGQHLCRIHHWWRRHHDCLFKGPRNSFRVSGKSESMSVMKHSIQWPSLIHMAAITSHAKANPAAYGFWFDSEIKFKYMTAMASQNANFLIQKSSLQMLVVKSHVNANPANSLQILGCVCWHGCPIQCTWPYHSWQDVHELSGPG